MMELLNIDFSILDNIGIYNIIYGLSIGVLAVALLYAIIQKKVFRLQTKLLLGFLLFTQLTWKYLPDIISDSMYVIAFILASICIVRNRVYINTKLNKE